MGSVELLPQPVAQRLLAAVESTSAIEGMEVNVAVGYGGREEIAQAVRDALAEAAAQGRTLEEVARSLSVHDIAEHLYTKGQPDPDLLIRTSGEQRLSGLPAMAIGALGILFCEVNWPAFRHIDFLRALRDYAHRERAWVSSLPYMAG